MLQIRTESHNENNAGISMRESLGEIRSSIKKFLEWLEKNGYESFDPYDIWGTPYALRARSYYYKKNPVGFLMVAPLLALEVLCPQARALFVRKERFATADGQLVLAFVNLWRVWGDNGYLAAAESIAENLKSYSVPGYSGYCWGYPFDWQAQRCFFPRDTPFITCTPYCFEAFLALHDATGKSQYLEVAESIAKFTFHDLKEFPTGSKSAASSYSPYDESHVVNAAAYRAMVLNEAAARFRVDAYRETAERQLNYIIESQRDDGSWLYATDGVCRFIDHFHTCFVLKNLAKANRRAHSTRVAQAIARGWQFYRTALFGADGLPKCFAIEPRVGLVRLELYNFAEAITLGALLRSETPSATDLAEELALRLIREYQLPDGHFVTRVFRGGIRHTFPFIRWPQAQLFFALTNVLLAAES